MSQLGLKTIRTYELKSLLPTKTVRGITKEKGLYGKTFIVGWNAQPDVEISTKVVYFESIAKSIERLHIGI
jgi:hypothetical protein